MKFAQQETALLVAMRMQCVMTLNLGLRSLKCLRNCVEL